ncbi:HAMP domain-containing sensor histidine kinase [Roseofilum casamattae]|uniref:histidine kinase n=1 Tax=Roseofilum casamattae BLCC-M143 TaxID=3022442 RepID=A0ABT7BYX6_9CYAN|nr:ATP-binding protein [Roseofilum casamattae]MDJ1184406.1 ATP-binding protein [Roseofilum casamattae BLCC-M143]
MLKNSKTQTISPRFRIPLPVVLVAPFVVQILLVVGLTGWFSLRNGQRAINQVSAQLRQEVTAGIERELSAYINNAYLVNEISREAVKLGLLDLENRDNVRAFLWSNLNNFDSITSLSFSYNDGGLLGIERSSDGFLLSRAEGQSDDVLKRYHLNESGERGELFSSVPDYDSRMQSWYESAVAAKEATWGGIYTYTNSQTLSSIVNQPVYDHEDRLLGVFSAEFQLSEISRFLRDLDISYGAEAFVLDRSGLLVASSTLERPFLVTYGTTLRIKAINSKDEVIQSSSEYLQRIFGDFDNLNSPQQLEFFIRGKRYFVQVTPLNNQRGIDWLIVVVVPEEDFMEEIDTNTWITIQLCLIALFISVFLGLITADWIIKSLNSLAQATERIARGHLTQHLPNSSLQEVERLSDSFNQMSEQLNHSFQALEQANETLEIRVQQRTQALQEEKEKTEEALQELQHTQAQLIQTEKMSSLGKMVGGVAHEINNPISFIYSNLPHAREYMEGLLALIHLYQKHYPEPNPEIEQQIDEIDLDFILDDFQELMDSMQNGSDRIQSIVLGLRAFARLDESEQKWADIKEGLENSLMVLQNKLHGIEVIENYEKVPNILCYAGELNQVFYQIIDNAIEAMLSADISKPRLLIETGYREPEKMVEIRISDNGKGMNEEVRSHIFDPFFTTKPVGKGTGLGLSISYQVIVEKQGGTLTCESAPSKGTTFLIELPLQSRRSKV